MVTGDLYSANGLLADASASGQLAKAGTPDEIGGEVLDTLRVGQE